MSERLVAVNLPVSSMVVEVQPAASHFFSATSSQQDSGNNQWYVIIHFTSPIGSSPVNLRASNIARHQHHDQDRDQQSDYSAGSFNLH